jgi:hypothetical protein
MNRKMREERVRRAQRIVARYIPKDRDLVAELIAERRAEAAAEYSEGTSTETTASSQTTKSKEGDK